MRTVCDSPSPEVEVQALEHGLLVLFHHFLPLNRTELLVVLTSLLRSCVFLSMRLHLTSSVSFISRFSPGVTSSRKLSLNPRFGEIPLLCAAIALCECLFSNVYLMLSLFPVGFDAKFPCSSFHWFSRYYNTKVTIIDAKFKQCKEHINDL